MKAKIEAINLSPARAILTWAMAVTIVVLATAYLFLVNAAVLKVVSWNQIQKNISAVNAKISETESEFALLRTSVTLEKAGEIGFSEVSNPIYITRQTLRQGLTFKNEI